PEVETTIDRVLHSIGPYADSTPVFPASGPEWTHIAFYNPRPSRSARQTHRAFECGFLRVAKTGARADRADRLRIHSNHGVIAHLQENRLRKLCSTPCAIPHGE